MSGGASFNGGNPDGEGSMSSHKLIITIDGPAGSGKSTAAQILAGRLDLSVLDTGAMYRTASLIALREGIDPEDGPQLAKRIMDRGIQIDFNVNPPRIRLDNVLLDEEIRSREVEDIVSRVAAQSHVRRALVAVQRKIASQHPRLVTEGRDQGSVVFPDAAVRFFLTASADLRAGRRVDQLRARGVMANLDEVQSGIEQRDLLDATRPDAPLIKPEGAIVINTDHLTLDEVVDHLEAEVRKSLESQE